MPASTPRGAIRYPLGTDPPDTDGDIRKVAEDVADRFAMFDESATRPAAGVRGRLHRDPATGQVTWDTGTAWQVLKVGDSDKLGGMPAPLYLLTSDANAAYTPARLWVPASQMTVVQGAPTLAANYTDWPGWLLDSALDESVGMTLSGKPKNWALSDIEAWWVKLGTGAGNVRWLLRNQQFSGGEALGAIAGGTLTSAAVGAGGVLTKTTIATGVGWDPNSVLNVRVSRLGSVAEDTYSGGDIALIGLAIKAAA